MFLEIFRFEWRQQVRAPLFWVVALAFGALAFAVASTEMVTVGGASGNVLRNAPLVIVRLMNVFGLLSMFLVTVFVAGAALRDFESRTAELLFTTPLSRGAYLGGRFAAGYLATLAIMLACALGIGLGTLMPWIDPLRLGAGGWHGYAWSFGVMVLPDMLFVAALLFLLASATRSLLATYLGVIAFFVLHAIAGLLTRDIDNHVVAALLDPFGGRTLAIVTRYWSTSQLNHRLPALDGLLLFNRLLWSALSVGLLAAAYLLFRTDREGLHLPRRRARAEPVTPPHAPPATPRRSAADRTAGWRVQLLQLRHLLLFDAAGVLGSVPFLVMLVFGLVNLLFTLALSGQFYGTATYPVTHQVLEQLRDSFQWLLFIIVAFYAGELVWRERNQRAAELIDAFPLRDWIPLLAKFGALLGVIGVFLLAGALTGIGWQLGHGYTRLQPGLYLGTLALDAVPFVLLAALALFLQVIANNKFLGYLLTILWFVGQIGLGLLHWDQHLYDYGSVPEVPYSDMNGFGHFLAAALWFDFYWGCCAAVLLVLAALFWVRGTDPLWPQRMREARARLRAPVRLALMLGLLGFLGSGAWIFYNTNVLNHYRSGEADSRRHADYEKQYARYKDLPQPRITAVQAAVDIYPYRRRLAIRGHYTLVNRHATPIRELHLTYADGFWPATLAFAPHDTVSEDRRLGYAIYRLKAPLPPGASMTFDFTLDYAPRGFTNDPSGQFLAHNGTFFNSLLMPQFGYQPRMQLTDRNDRRKYGLDPRMPRMPALGNEQARANSYISNDADWIRFDTTVSTAADQIALAPGYLQRSWTVGGRRYFHYTLMQSGLMQRGAAQDGGAPPMLPFFAYLSARYAVRKDSWHGVAIEVYYNPAHAWNVDRMVQGVKDALAYYDARFTPYQFRQLRIVEFPNYLPLAQSFAGTIPFSESLGFIADLRDPSTIDYPYYVTAHEVAHQWWAHRVVGANVQGATMLSESLAQYSALMVMKHRYGGDQMHRFLKYELDHYLAGRAREKVAEQPLAKVEDQPYIHYRKGSLVFYALQDYLGEDRLDAVLRQFLLDKGFQSPPYPTSQEFMDALGKAAGPQWKGLLDDLFWKITLFDNRITDATATKLPDGRYAVTMKLHTGKVHVDGSGRETAAAPDIPLEIGVFAAAPGKGRDGRPLYLEKRVLPAGDSTLTVIVDGVPAEAGIDPYNELIDRVSGDNRRTVVLQ
jgi:ABC-type transport system involved in multi-copper enzyme maturation permease subunit